MANKDGWEDIVWDFGGGFSGGVDFGGQDAFSQFYTHQDRFSKEDKQLIKCIQAEAAEYYTKEFHVDISQKTVRQNLSKTDKERIFGFMKERLKWYGENGFLISQEVNIMDEDKKPTKRCTTCKAKEDTGVDYAEDAKHDFMTYDHPYADPNEV